METVANTLITAFNYILVGVFFIASSIWITSTFKAVYIGCGNLIRNKKVHPVTAFIIMVAVDMILVWIVGFILMSNL